MKITILLISIIITTYAYTYDTLTNGEGPGNNYSDNAVAFTDGPWTSGGGLGVVYPDKTVRFLDFIHPDDLPDVATTNEFRLKLFWTKKRYVEKIFEEAPEFFIGAKEILKELNINSEYPIVDMLIKHIDDLNPLYSEGRAINKNYFSQSISQRFQELLAVYSGTQLLISKRPSLTMSTEDQNGLAVHEAFRHLNFLKLLVVPLSTKEIEVLVRHCFNKSFNEDFNLIRPILNKLKNVHYKNEEVEKLIKEYNRIRAQKINAEKKRFDKKLPLEERSKFEANYITLDTKEDLIMFSIINNRIEALKYSASTKQRMYEQFLTQKTKLCRRIDVRNFQVINSCSPWQKIKRWRKRKEF